MKQLVVARIVIWSVVTVILTALLGWGLVGKQIGGGWNASGYTRAGSAEFMAGQIDEVRVEWVSGTVHIEEGRKVSFSESSYETIEEEEQLQYRLDGRTLVIRYGTGGGLFSVGMPTKDLTLTLPDTLNSLEIEVVSANVEMEGEIYAEEISLEGVSGSWSLANVSASDLSWDTVSGDLELGVQKPMGYMDLNSVSGSMTIYWPSSQGMSVEFDTLSGDFQSAFTMHTREKRSVYADGSGQIKADSVSGDLRIEKQS